MDTRTHKLEMVVSETNDCMTCIFFMSNYRCELDDNNLGNNFREWQENLYGKVCLDGYVFNLVEVR